MVCARDVHAGEREGAGWRRAGEAGRSWGAREGEKEEEAHGRGVAEAELRGRSATEMSSSGRVELGEEEVAHAAASRRE